MGSTLRVLVPGVRVLDCLVFMQEDESRPGALPRVWAVTSDSIAARAAVVFGAERLVLLKSVDVPDETSWEHRARRGWIDSYFARVLENSHCAVELVNFRKVLTSP
jgi:aspartokinase-like uncharacterized kinase